MSDGAPKIQYTLGWAYDTPIKPSHLLRRNYTDIAYVCWFMRRGTLSLQYAHSTLSVKSGQWVFIDPLGVKSHIFSADSHLVSIRFTASLGNLHYIPPLGSVVVLEGAEHPQLLQIATDLCEANTKTSFTVPIEFCRLQSLFYAWLCHWHTVREQFAGSGLINEKEIDSRVFSIMACVEEQGYPRVIDYQKLARTVGLSRSQVDRVFLKNTGYTIHEWNDNQCLRKAELLLDNPALSVKEIAAELRFLTASHFTRWFSGKTRLTPQAWRKYHG